MPRLDIIHNAVKTDLIKDGWTITDDPYILKYRRTILYADLGAERTISAQRDNQKLVIEIKSFIGVSKVQDLKEALGQLDIYSYLLEEIEPERRLYLAISNKTYRTHLISTLGCLQRLAFSLASGLYPERHLCKGFGEDPKWVL